MPINDFIVVYGNIDVFFLLLLVSCLAPRCNFPLGLSLFKLLLFLLFIILGCWGTTVVVGSISILCYKISCCGSTDAERTGRTLPSGLTSHTRQSQTRLWRQDTRLGGKGVDVKEDWRLDKPIVLPVIFKPFCWSSIIRIEFFMNNTKLAMMISLVTLIWKEFRIDKEYMIPTSGYKKATLNKCTTD